MAEIVQKIQYFLALKVDERFFIPVGMFILSCIIAAAWIFDWPTLKSMGNNRVTMKFQTVLAFGFLSTQMICHLKGLTKLSAFLGGTIFISGAWTITSFFLGNSIFFLPDFETCEEMHYESVRGDMPSWATLYCLMFAALAVEWEHLRGQFIMTSAIISGLALISYLIQPWINLPAWRYYIPGMSTSMAMHTAVFILHVTVWIDLLQKKK